MTRNTILPFQFDANAYDLPSGGSLYLTKSGHIDFQISDAYMQASRNNAANMMAIINLDVIGGDLAGQATQLRLNIINSSKEAAKIASQELAAICTAVGVAQLTDLRQIVGRRGGVTVIADEKVDKDDENKKYWENKFRDWTYASGESIVRGNFGGAAAPAAGGYAQPAAPAAPAAPQAPQPIAPQPQYAQQPAPVQPAAPVQPQAPIQPQQPMQPQQVQQPQYAQPQQPQVQQPQYAQQPQQPQYAQQQQPAAPQFQQPQAPIANGQPQFAQPAAPQL